MHESSLIKNMIAAIEQVRAENGARPVKRIEVELAQFGTMDEEHFRFHFKEAVKGTSLAKAKIDFTKVPFGTDARLVSVTLAQKGQTGPIPYKGRV